MKRYYMEKEEEEHLQEEARLDAEFAEANPDLVAAGIEREDWEAFCAACDKDD